MSVFTEKEATMENSKAYRKNIAVSDSLHAFFGYAENYNVYTGKILHADEHCIEHDINCFEGCSGAVLFLLEDEYAGRAVAVRVGSPTNQEANLAFKFFSALDNPHTTTT